MSVDYSVMSRASKSFYAFQRNQEMANMRKSFHSMLYQWFAQRSRMFSRTSLVFTLWLFIRCKCVFVKIVLNKIIKFLPKAFWFEQDFALNSWLYLIVQETLLRSSNSEHYVFL